MRYSAEPRFRKYVKEYGFLSFARTFVDKYGKKLIDTATKTGMNAAKTDCFEHKVWHHYIKMEFQKIANFLNTTSDDNDLPRFLITKWIEIYDQSEKNYNPNKEIRIKTSMIRSDLCNFSDAYIVVEGDITLEDDNDRNKRNKNLAF